MRIAVATLASASPYGQSKYILEKKTRDETHEQFEERSWKQRCHVDKDGMVFIPPAAFKNCIAEAAKYKPIQIKGKGKATYTKHIVAGVMCMKPVPLGVHIDDMQGLSIPVPPDGKRGGSKRVWKTFPFVNEWRADVEFCVLDEIVSNDVFRQYLIDAGQFIGIGYFRPINHGYWGRFSVEDIAWTQL